jgi:trans-2,3-dihydro-3-hydroxyanthranilate isomerase
LTRYRYLHLDVFAAAALEGNQLAVVFEAQALAPAVMQAIAREMAFSETVFVVPGESAGAVARLRIFTPGRELPMAGHPTIGSAFALVHDRHITAPSSPVILDLGIGPTRLDLDWKDGHLAFAWMTQPAPVFGPIVPAQAAVAAALGLTGDDIARTGLPVQSVSCALPYLFVPLATREAVDRAWLDQHALTRLSQETGVDEQGVFVFSTEPVDPDVTTYSRMFAPGFGIPEDPATGSASGPLGCYLVQHGVVAPAAPARMLNLQGVKMQRPSRIAIAIDGEAGRITGVRVGGTSIVVAAGTLFL